MCPRKPLSHSFAALLAGCALTGCLLVPSAAGSAPPPDSLASLTIHAFPEPIPAPALLLERVDGPPLRLEGLRGRVVFLNFWASWCAPCRQEMPAMERLYRAYEKRGLSIVAVNYGESKAELDDVVKRFSLTFPAVLDARGEAARALGVRGLPVSALLDRDGRILWKAMGPREWDGAESRAYFEKLLASSRRQ